MSPELSQKIAKNPFFFLGSCAQMCTRAQKKKKTKTKKKKFFFQEIWKNNGTTDNCFSFIYYFFFCLEGIFNRTRSLNFGCFHFFFGIFFRDFFFFFGIFFSTAAPTDKSANGSDWPIFGIAGVSGVWLGHVRIVHRWPKKKNCALVTKMCTGAQDFRLGLRPFGCSQGITKIWVWSDSQVTGSGRPVHRKSSLFTAVTPGSPAFTSFSESQSWWPEPGFVCVLCIC